MAKSSRSSLLRFAAEGVLALSMVVVAGAPANVLAFPASRTVQFQYTGVQQLYTVPAQISCVEIVAYGAEGGKGENPDGSLVPGGYGGLAKAKFVVTPLQVLEVWVGGQGESGSGGFNGGGDVSNSVSSQRGGGGGGASDVRLAPYTLDRRLIVAGGGGGGGADNDFEGMGGAGGADLPYTVAGRIVSPGLDGQPSDGGTPAGSGGSDQGGAGGTTDPTAASGDLGTGGLGGSGNSFSDGGGGGGAGFYGGGGGAGEDETINDNGGGGGGGSSVISTDWVAKGKAEFRGGVRTGNGFVQITALTSKCQKLFP